VIRVEHLVKKFGARTVISDVAFDVPAGQSLALVGPSGGGKSTLLRCLLGLESFDGGRITIAGATLAAQSERANRVALPQIRAAAGLVFQQWHLFAHMTALENIREAPVHVRRLPIDEATKQARTLLEKVGMSHRADALPRRLSGGEQQRVAIARALAMEPRVLFMDEPTSALDPERVGELVTLLRGLAREGLTLVCITHDIDFAAALCDRVIVLAGGELVEDGAPAEVLAAPKHAATRKFLGRD